MSVSKPRDLVERVLWTFIQAEIALGALDWIAKGINLNLLHQLEVSAGAALAATIKVLIAQQFGKRGSGDAIPGGVEKAVAAPPAAEPVVVVAKWVAPKKPPAKKKPAAKKTAAKKRPAAKKR